MSTVTTPAHSGLVPDWFEIHATGWICHHPTCPSDYDGEFAHPEEWINSRALAHLNDHHPRWKRPCTRCGTPQWNAEGRPTCFRCRT